MKEKEFHLKPWPGQIWVKGETSEFLPPSITFYHKLEKCNSKIEHAFTVMGKIYDVDFNTSYILHKVFDNLKDAESYLNEAIKQHPYSNLKLSESTLKRHLKYY